MSAKSPIQRDFVLNGGIRTLKDYGDKHDMKRLIVKHNDIQDSYHIDFFDMFVAASVFEEDSTDFSMFFENIFMLTTPPRYFVSLN